MHQWISADRQKLKRGQFILFSPYHITPSFSTEAVEKRKGKPFRI